jgi:hypothetical protein
MCLSRLQGGDLPPLSELTFLEDANLYLAHCCARPPLGPPPFLPSGQRGSSLFGNPYERKECVHWANETF